MQGLHHCGPYISLLTNWPPICLSGFNPTWGLYAFKRYPNGNQTFDGFAVL